MCMEQTIARQDQHVKHPATQSNYKHLKKCNIVANIIEGNFLRFDSFQLLPIFGPHSLLRGLGNKQITHSTPPVLF